MKAHATGYSSPQRKDVDGKTLEDNEYLTAPGAPKPSTLSEESPTSPTAALQSATRTLHSLSTLIPPSNQNARSGTYGWSGDEIDLCNFIRTNLNGPSDGNAIGEPIRIRPSRDAGRYLCEWIYWCSCREALTNPPGLFSPPASPIHTRGKSGDYGFPTGLVHPTPISPGTGATNDGPFSSIFNAAATLNPNGNGNRNEIIPSPVPGTVPEDNVQSPTTPYYGGWTGEGAEDEADPLNEDIDNEGAEYISEHVKRTKRVLFVHVPPFGQPYLQGDGVRVLEQVTVGMVREGERLKSGLAIEAL